MCNCFKTCDDDVDLPARPSKHPASGPRTAKNPRSSRKSLASKSSRPVASTEAHGPTDPHHMSGAMQQEDTSTEDARPPSNTSADASSFAGPCLDSGYASSIMTSPNPNTEAFSSSPLPATATTTAQYLGVNHPGTLPQPHPRGRNITVDGQHVRHSTSGSRSAASSRPASRNGTSHQAQLNPPHLHRNHYQDNTPAPDYATSIQSYYSPASAPQVVVNVHPPPPSVYNYGITGTNYYNGGQQQPGLVAWNGGDQTWTGTGTAAAVPSIQTWTPQTPAIITSPGYASRSSSADDSTDYYNAVGSQFSKLRGPVHPSRIYDDVPDNSNSLGASSFRHHDCQCSSNNPG